MRMALDLGLHRALEKLADSNPATASSSSMMSIGEASPDSAGGSITGRRRTEEQERDLGQERSRSSLTANLLMSLFSSVDHSRISAHLALPLLV